MPKTCVNGCPYPVFSKGRCNKCWRREFGKPLPRSQKPIAPASAKRRIQLSAYRELRAEFFKEPRECEAKLKGCTGQATDLHHVIGRQGEALNDKTKWKALCRACHDTTHRKSKEAYASGLMERRNQPISKP